jgi:hypothetical protein
LIGGLVELFFLKCSSGILHFSRMNQVLHARKSWLGKRLSLYLKRLS